MSVFVAVFCIVKMCHGTVHYVVCVSLYITEKLATPMDSDAVLVKVCYPRDRIASTPGQWPWALLRCPVDVSTRKACHLAYEGSHCVPTRARLGQCKHMTLHLTYSEFLKHTLPEHTVY